MTYNQCKLFHDIEKSLTIKPGMKLQDLARYIGCSDRTIEKIIRKYTSLSFREYKRVKLLQTTKSMLLHGCSVKEIGLEIGYKWPNNFSRSFKRFTGSSISKLNRSNPFHLAPKYTQKNNFGK